MGIVVAVISHYGLNEAKYSGCYQPNIFIHILKIYTKQQVINKNKLV